MVLHASNLRPVKRIDLLLKTVAQIKPRESFKLVILAGGDFLPYAEELRWLGLEDRVVVRNNVRHIEDYLQAADFGLFTSESESFCLSILEAMCFAHPSVASQVGGIPEVIQDGVTGFLRPFGDTEAMANAAEKMIGNPEMRRAFGRAARERAHALFSAKVIVPRYEALYRKVCS
jgi:glycosyltransferase involved in cell wall biosynthesis